MTRSEYINEFRDYARTFTCPLCAKEEDFQGEEGCDIDSNHFVYCVKHKTCFNWGADISSTWRDKTEEEFEANLKMLSDYEPMDFIILPEILEFNNAT